jgi:putative endonuclease
MNKSPYKSPWYVYIVECRDTSLYVGIALDLAKRISEHNSSETCKYTRTRKPVILRYQERLADHSAALRREAAIKKLNREKKLALFR